MQLTSGYRAAVLGLLMTVTSCVATPGPPPVTMPSVRSTSPLVSAEPEQPSVEPADDLLLPDLRVNPPRQLFITRDEDRGVRQIRFSTTIINVGEAPLRVRGRTDRMTRRTIATQLIDIDGGGTERHRAGSFVFHPGHDHWHFEDFTAFELWTVDERGQLGSLIATTDKMSFCIWDSGRMSRRVEGAPSERRFERCPRSVQGLSVGWADRYRATTEGQHLDLPPLPDGRYAIRSTVDPADRLREADESNNDVVAHVQITGMDIRRISSSSDL